jgi:TIR domain
MLVFLSWSGARSKAVAEAMQGWLSQVIQTLEPWLSSDIEKGSKWGHEISDKLERSTVGIICLTSENLNAPWLLFEAGALSKTKDAYVCTLLLGLDPAQILQPLAQFQSTTFEKDDFRRMLHSINKAVQRSGERFLSDSVLNQSFDVFWPRLEDQISNISAQLPEENDAADDFADLLPSIRPRDQMMDFVGIALLRAKDAAAPLEEIVPSFLTIMGPSGRSPLDPRMLAVFAIKVEQILARLIDEGLVTVEDELYTLTPEGRAEFQATSERHSSLIARFSQKPPVSSQGMTPQ